MGYVDKVLGPNEHVVHETGLHWVTFVSPCAGFCSSPFALVFADVVVEPQTQLVIRAAALLFVVFSFFSALIDWWTTEIAVTTRRVISKRGLIARDTIELNFNRIEGLDVRQSITGHILGFGTVAIRGTGIGYQPMGYVGAPIELRNAAFR